MQEQRYRCGIAIEHPLAACQYRRKCDGACTLMPDTPCQYKFKINNCNPEVSDEQETVKQ